MLTPAIRVGATSVLVTAMLWMAAVSAAKSFSPWAPAQKVDEIAGNSAEVNTTSADGCPIQSPNGLSLYLASNRPGGHGGLDIWVAHRPSTTAPWGAPENLGEPVNSAADDFCPTPIRGGGLFFVSREALPGSCGMGDIYLARRNPSHGWSEPQHLSCGPDGPNSTLDEMGPSYVKVGGRKLLYFSSGPDIYVSERGDNGGFGPATPVAELNSPTAADIQPNVRKDGLEVVFASNRRAGTDQDVYVATRDSVDDPFSGAGQPGRGREHGHGQRDPSLLLLGRDHAVLRPRAGSRRRKRHLRDHSDEDLGESMKRMFFTVGRKVEG